MANLFVDLPMPVLNGPGAAVDTSALGQNRSIVCKGSFPGVTITIQISNDGGISWAPLVTFTSVGKKKVVDVAAEFMRVNVRGRNAGDPFSANCDVGSTDDGGTYAVLPLPALNGTGAPVDVSALGVYTTVVVAGTWERGLITVESSEDGNDWAACGPSYQSGSTQRSGEVIANFMRTRVAGRRAGDAFSASVSVGAVNDPSAAGGPPTGPAGGDLSGTYPNPLIGRPRHCFVYQPGGVAQANVYTDWATLVAAMSAVDGAKTLCFDNSIVSPIPIPVGAWDMSDVTWRGPYNVATPVTVQVPEGVTLPNLKSFAQGIYVENQATATPPVVLVANDQVTIRDSVDIHTTGSVEFFQGPAGFFLFNLIEFGTIGFVGPGPVVSVPNGGFVFFNLQNFSQVRPDTLVGVAGASAQFQLSTTSSAVFEPQSSWLGNPFAYTYIQAETRNLNPASGTAPATANITSEDIGDLLRLDTTAGTFTQILPVIAGGAQRVTAGSWVGVKETSGVNPLTVAGQGGDTIDGVATVDLPAGGAGIFVSDGVSDWHLLAVYDGVVSGRKLLSPPEKWTQQNVAASQSNVDLSALVSTSFDTIKAIRAGSIVGLSTRFTGPITDATAGSAVVTVTINGATPAGALSVSHSSGSNPSGGEAVQNPGIYAYNAGDLLGIEITTLGSFAPAGSLDVEAWLEVEE
ncbi:MAG: hypothetical protein KJO40_13440 [Deltaproteobacteria bacterium]|nr:hypothetical protein [Deltaproteobacteria bacterium]